MSENINHAEPRGAGDDRAVDDNEHPADVATADAQHTVGGGQKEIAGRGGPDPTRYGDWEKAGRCIDF